MELSSLKDLFASQLRELYTVEEMQDGIFDEVCKAVRHQAVCSVLEKQSDQSFIQKQRIVHISDVLNIPMRKVEVPVMDAVLKELSSLREKVISPEVLDAALLAVVQKLRHFEITAYGTAAAYAMELGYREMADILHTSMLEEKEADRNLSELALREINEDAVEKSGEDARIIPLSSQLEWTPRERLHRSMAPGQEEQEKLLHPSHEKDLVSGRDMDLTSDIRKKTHDAEGEEPGTSPARRSTHKEDPTW